MTGKTRMPSVRTGSATGSSSAFFRVCPDADPEVRDLRHAVEEGGEQIRGAEEREERRRRRPADWCPANQNTPLNDEQHDRWEQAERDQRGADEVAAERGEEVLQRPAALVVGEADHDLVERARRRPDRDDRKAQEQVDDVERDEGQEARQTLERRGSRGRCACGCSHFRASDAPPRQRGRQQAAPWAWRPWRGSRRSCRSRRRRSPRRAPRCCRRAPEPDRATSSGHSATIESAGVPLRPSSARRAATCGSAPSLWTKNPVIDRVVGDHRLDACDGLRAARAGVHASRPPCSPRTRRGSRAPAGRRTTCARAITSGGDPIRAILRWPRRRADRRPASRPPRSRSRRTGSLACRTGGRSGRSDARGR